MSECNVRPLRRYSSDFNWSIDLLRTNWLFCIGCTENVTVWKMSREITITDRTITILLIAQHFQRFDRSFCTFSHIFGSETFPSILLDMIIRKTADQHQLGWRIDDWFDFSHFADLPLRGWRTDKCVRTSRGSFWRCAGWYINWIVD